MDPVTPVQASNSSRGTMQEVRKKVNDVKYTIILAIY